MQLFLGKDYPLGPHIAVDTRFGQGKVCFGYKQHIAGDKGIIKPAGHSAAPDYYDPQLLYAAQSFYLAAHIIIFYGIDIINYHRNGASGVCRDNGQVAVVLLAWYVNVFVIFEILPDKFGFAKSGSTVYIHVLFKKLCSFKLLKRRYRLDIYAHCSSPRYYLTIFFTICHHLFG